MRADSGVSIEALEAVRRPTTQARGLPNECYADPGFLPTEVKRVFGPTWTAVAFGSDAPNKGDVIPVDFAGVPLALVRDRRGTLRVFHNVCRHRGYKLIQEPTNLKAVIRCPYHGWCYGLDGNLRATPSIGGSGANSCSAFDKSGNGLFEARAAVWGDIVFVNLDGQAEPFEDYIAPIAQRWGEFRDQSVYPGTAESAFELTVATNWKLAVENFCESYHLPAVHPELNKYSPLSDHYSIQDGWHRFAGQGSRVYQPLLSADGRSFPPVEGLSDFWRTGSEYIALFPNLLLGIHKDHYYGIILMPEGVGQTRERVQIYYFDTETAQGESMAELRRNNAAMWHQVFCEDIFVVEGMQQGRQSPAFDGGVFTPVMDPPTHDFHRWIADRLLAEADGGAAESAETPQLQALAG